MNQHDPADPLDPPAIASTADHTLEERSRARLAVDAQFSAFYRKTIKRLTGFLINHGASLPVAADIAQDAMTKAYQRWGDLREPQAWVHIVASRAYIRKATDLREEPVDQVPEPTSLLPRPDTAADWEARHDTLQLAKKLPYRQRQILAWTLSGYTPSEIAQQLELTPEAVRASLKKARRTLAEYIRQGEEEQ
ncbi:sigma-70 family RNA polymerase sigma factor [Streptomyces syringium]|uniref:RNA polymerase sigma factor n=1 Tax=Streptomyces syringium TaxID=76729 RepID=UPI003433CD0E